MKHNDTIRQHSSIVLFRISLFIFVYIGLIAIGVLLIWLAYRFCFWGVLHLTALHSIRLMLLLLALMVGGIGFSLMFGIYLVKFIFSRTINNNESRRLITETECPQLFQAIREVALETQCPMPKKVYLSPDVNACVFYNTSFWSIFFPVKKNLEIGLGLFNATNTDELKGILAHEFGHFSQKSMKVGSTVYIANTVIYNLAFQEDKWDKWVDEWCVIPIQSLAFFGKFTRIFTNLVKRILQYMYRVVNHSYFKLSRQMEYDADRIACDYIGKDVFASALYKIEILASSFNVTKEALANLAEEKKKVNNFFEAYQIITDIITQNNHLSISYQSLIDQEIPTLYPPSRIVIENTWDTHPSTEKRVSHLTSRNSKKKVTSFVSSWTLLPENIKLKVADIVENEFQTSAEAETLETISNEAFRQWYLEYYRNNIVIEKYRYFLNRNILVFDRSEVAANKIDIPFTAANCEVIKEYEVALNDCNTLYNVYYKQIEVESIRYLNEECSIKALPIKRHEEYVETLSVKVKQIDKDIYQYLMYCCQLNNNALTNEINSIYDAIFFAQTNIKEHDSELDMRINALINELNRPVNRTDKEIIELKKMINSLTNDIKKIVSADNWDLLSTVGNTKMIELLQTFVQSPLDESTNSVIDTEQINTMIQVKVIYFYLLKTLEHKSKIKLGAKIEEIERNLPTID